MAEIQYSITEPSDDAEIQIVRGRKFPGSKRFSRENIEASLDYCPRDGDIIVASYPKTGTTWMQYIVLQIVSKGEIFPTMNDLLYKVCPFMEIAGISAIEKLEPPRVYKHHIPYDMVRKNPKAKTIYTYRKPEDTFVSFYHFLNSFSETPLDFDAFIEDVITGNIGYGRYFEHLLTYEQRKDDQNLLLVSYEILHANTKQEVLRIAKFLGEKYHRSLVEDDSLLQDILEHTSFDYMRNNLHFTVPFPKDVKNCDHDATPKKSQFFRKGVVGDGKASLSPEQLQRIRRAAEEVLKGTLFEKEWYQD